jgi:hypothetical protein
MCFRDLLVKKKFESNPVLWSIMEFVASGKEEKR